MVNDWLYDWFWIPFLGSFNIPFFGIIQHPVFWVYSRFPVTLPLSVHYPFPVAFNVPVFGYIKRENPHSFRRSLSLSGILK
ncbi:putative membrane protein [Escherichia phage YDC107_2]|nr:putative membrane protein [Escherichia phage YDC107_2]